MVINNSNKKANSAYYSSQGYASGYKPYDAVYGPWNSFKEMIDILSPGEVSSNEEVEPYLKNNEVIPVGLTVAIVEGDKIVEYWNPVEGQGFIKKVSDASIINVSSYEEALTYVTNENIGKIIVISDDESDSDDESGVYIVSENGKLIKLGGDSSEKINQIENTIEEIENIIEEDEETIAAALNDLNKRITNHPIEGIADNSKDLLNIDDDSKLEAKIGDLSIRQVA